MKSLHLAKLSKLKCAKEVELPEIIENIKKILSRGSVEETIAVGHDKQTVVGNHPLFKALEWLGVTYVPISNNLPEKTYVPVENLGFFNKLKPSKYRVFKDTEELLYKNWPTPLVRLKNSSLQGRTVWAKLESYNPWSASIKDRIGWYMFKKLTEKLGNPPKLIYEATSTNTGLALAALSSIHGLKFRAYLPSTAAAGEALLKIYGAEVIVSPKPLTVDLIADVKSAADSDGAANLNQFENDANLEVHLKYTAKELELQIRKAGILPKAIIGGLGTSGHMSAIALYFKSRFNNVKIYGVVPRQGESIRGIRRVETGMKWIKYVELDGVIEVSLKEATKSAIEIANRDGILVGLSSGAVYHAYKAMVEAGQFSEGDYILIFPDTGFKYVENYQLRS
ncbi:MAG: pyridoxal-phosphate dependent enzyme [Sulfolobales archaeon]|nr:pyridoxal-phosphate dependent enzyme [Sulfolobales archaeon]MDW8004898.1 pyridoxal-phosphate dependent enzyme [Thermofilaceae archaeon]